jgi:sugar lactone lactonase YvrE
MAIKVSGTTVIDSSRQLANIASLDTTTKTTFENTLDLNNRTVGTVTGNATLDLSTGTIFEHTPTANTTFVFSNPPASGTGYSFDLKVTGAEVANGYDLANAEPPAYGVFSVAAQELIPTDLFFKPDGTKVYIVGSSGDDVNEYDLSTAWDISTASYVQNFSVAAQEISPYGLFFKSDGTKMYVTGTSGRDVNEYDLSTAWDISTASYLQNFSVSTQDTAPSGLFFKPDGLKMYVIGSSSDNVNEYDLSTAWDISTASYVQNFSVSAQEFTPSGLFFKSDGLKMYVIGSSGDDVNEYDLSTAWDISTASYVQNFSVSTQDSSPQGLFFKPDGLKMYVIGLTSDSIYSYNLTTAWDISTASFDFPAEGYFSVAAQDIAPKDLFFKPDGLKMYIIGGGGDDVNEYDLSTAWDISTASYLQNFSVSSQDASPTGLFFKSDGLKMYIVGGSDAVHEYDLSTAWDISTASYLQNFSVAAQEDASTGLFFKSDGLKMYIVGSAGDEVNEYDLSTAWDISTASYVQNFSVAAQDLIPEGLFFKPDGTKMYVIGANSDNVNEYDLSTAWDISTASYLQNFSVSTQDSSPSGLFFKPDGFKMYIVGSAGDAVWAYTTGVTTDATFTYPASVEWPSGTIPSSPANGETDTLTFLTIDGGTTYYGVQSGDDFS